MRTEVLRWIVVLKTHEFTENRVIYTKEIERFLLLADIRVTGRI
jgi:hypothetical protein